MKRSFKDRYLQAVDFISHDIWFLDSDSLSRGKYRLIRYAKAIIITIKGIGYNRIGPQAASLTFLTIVALVPLLAFIYAFTKAWGYAQMLEEFLYRNLDGLKEAVDAVLGCAQNIITTGSNGLFGLIGALVFFWSVLWLIFRIEQVFNLVWQVKTNRNLSHRILYYLAVLIIIPITVVLVIAFTVFYNSMVDRLPIAAYYISSMKPIVGWLSFYIFIVLLFFVQYKLIPNTKVRFFPAFNAAIIAALAMLVIMILYMETQLFITRLNTVYGALAAIPLLLVWLNIVWNITLFGAELSFGFQNIEGYEFEQVSSKSSIYQRNAAAILVCRQVCLRWKNGQSPASIEEMAQDLMLPVRMVNISIQELCELNILVEAKSSQQPDVPYYVPAIDINRITVSFVLEKLQKSGETRITRYIRKDMRKVLAVLERANQVFAESPDNKLLIDL